MLHTPEHLHFEGNSRTPLGVNVTPLIDCVFLLLVFFMLTTSFLEEQSLILHVSSSGRSAAVEQIVVDIARDGAIAVDGKPVALEEVTARIRPILSDAKKHAVSIRAERDVPVQRTVAVMDRIRAAGTDNIRFLTRTGL